VRPPPEPGAPGDRVPPVRPVDGPVGRPDEEPEEEPEDDPVGRPVERSDDRPEPPVEDERFGGRRGDGGAIGRTTLGADPSRSTDSSQLTSQIRASGSPSEAKTTNAPARGGGVRANNSGGVLLSQGVYPQVPLALTGLTAVFGMGTGVPPSL
jgi:hypothetical protein